ncbi:aminopeptidase N [Vibrio hangzhouensis]|uniref:Aminopeptidase N n=1 Tax=Vibrio hangzhouensis TaxID=462991 RepID=A0A1H5YDP6_9VIBR|nr:aminopeptidase N [Vibrio hangzhouensis]SEG22173.1 aminopeptidase N [Vibrio hangzhouensis]
MTESAPKAKYRSDYQSPSHTITDVNLTFDLHETATKVVAVSQVKQLAQSSTLSLDGEGIELISVDINGVSWNDYVITDAGIELHNLPSEFELKIENQISPSTNTALEGLYISDGAYCTQCEAEGFRRITYFLDRPDVLAKYTTKVIADKDAFPFLLSNGNKVAEGNLESGKHFVTWEDPHPKPSYLFALVAGDFDVLRDSYTTRSGRHVALEIFVDKGNLNRANHAMVSLINSMKWDEERFGLEYDLDIYMIVAVDFFNMGAMENKGLNVFNSKFVLANEQTATDTDYLGIEAVIGHEYFHNWTGNRVTCRDWFQLSLKEGLTVFRDQEFSSDLGSRSVNRINNVRIIRGPQFAEDASPMSHPIRPEKVIEMNNFYTLTVYEKGSEVIRMMHTLLGEAKFQAGMKLYFERHDGTAATCEDFVSAMEDASGIDLKQFRLWYSQSGTPTLTVTDHYDEVAKTYTLTVNQETKATQDQSDKQALHIPFDVELYDEHGKIIELHCNGVRVGNVLNITESEQAITFEQVNSKPVPSMLREFSAPVRLDFNYSDEQLAFLMVHAQNEFAKWDAGQMLLAKYIKSNVVSVQNGRAVELPELVIDAFRGVILNEKLDHAFISEALSLPSFNEVAGWYDIVDVDAVCDVLKGIKLLIANALQDEFAALYHTLAQFEYTIEHNAIGKRSLRNLCLQYLVNVNEYAHLAEKQYQSANNMTDTMAAMTAANSAALSYRQNIMDDYSEKWSHDGLVMDKWFALQGMNPAEDALENVKNCMSHCAFSLSNPNRTRSLIGSFLNMNPRRFHDKSGQGYEFAGEILTKLNESNPQVASRLIDPLLKFKKYDVERQALIKQELEKLRNLDNLAKDLFEKVSKALES